jgi:hypothetical protein
LGIEKSKLSLVYLVYLRDQVRGASEIPLTQALSRRETECAVSESVHACRIHLRGNDGHTTFPIHMSRAPTCALCPVGAAMTP